MPDTPEVTRLKGLRRTYRRKAKQMESQSDIVSSDDGKRFFNTRRLTYLECADDVDRLIRRLAREERV